MIQPGDTLWSLADWYGVAIDRIAAANPGIDPENLMAGEVIAIPTAQIPQNEQWWGWGGPWGGGWRGPWGGYWGGPPWRRGWGPWWWGRRYW